MIADDSRFHENQALPYKNSPFVIQLKFHWPIFRMTQLISPVPSRFFFYNCDCMCKVFVVPGEPEKSSHF